MSVTDMTVCAGKLTADGGSVVSAHSLWGGALPIVQVINNDVEEDKEIDDVSIFDVAQCPAYDMSLLAEGSASLEAGYIMWDEDFSSAPYLCRPNMRPAKEFFRVTITREINPADCKKY